MKKCPKCGKKLARIIYGLPSPEMSESAARGNVFLGGCSTSDEMPSYHCYHCILDFNENLEEPGSPNPYLEYEVSWNCLGDHFGWGHTCYRIYNDRHIEKIVKDHKSDDGAAGLGYLRLIGEYRPFSIRNSEYEDLKNTIEKALEPFRKDQVEFIAWNCDGAELSIVKYNRSGNIVLNGNIVDESMERQLAEELGLLSRIYVGSHTRPEDYRK